MHANGFTTFAALVLATAPATAQSIEGIKIGHDGSARVAFGDLDLSSVEGSRMLHLRLRRAVNRVCAIERSRDRWDYEVMVACQRRTLAHVTAGLAPALAAAERTRLAAAATSGASSR